MIAGLAIAAAGYFWINRLVPAHVDGRSRAEFILFLVLWGACLAHALLRPMKRIWLEQLSAAAALCLGLPALNMLTSDKSLLQTLPAGMWRVAGVDIVAFLFGILFAAVAWRFAARRDVEAYPLRLAGGNRVESHAL